MGFLYGSNCKAILAILTKEKLIFVYAQTATVVYTCLVKRSIRSNMLTNTLFDNRIVLYPFLMSE